MESPSNPRKRKLSSKTEPTCQEESWEVNDLLNKRYEIINEDYYHLPEPMHMFPHDNWSIPKLQKLKTELNRTKSRLNDFNLMKWQQHTRRRNRAGLVQWKLKREIDPEFLTQAWCKLYENVCSFPLVPSSCLEKKKLNSVHLCEAPGAFVTSLNHYLQLNAPDVFWNWMATSLNPHYEGNSLDTMINDDRLMLHTEEHWFFGRDCTGDIMKLENLEELVSKAQEMGEVGLVTADGSISCINAPDEQESIVTRLHLCETIAALKMLDESGSLLIKVFTVFEAQTVCLMFLLTCAFERVVMNKPGTSSEGNSEVYVVCLGFKGRERIEGQLEALEKRYDDGEMYEGPMFRRCDIPEEFVEEVYKAGEFFMRKQCEVIEGNIAAFLGGGLDGRRARVRAAVAEEFMSRYRLEKLLREEAEIVGKQRLGMFGCEAMESRFSDDSYNDRKRKEDMGTLDRLRILEEQMEKIHVEREAFVFRFSGDPGPLKITLGKPYESVNNSRFCAAKILKNLHSALQVQKKLELNVQSTNVEVEEKLMKLMSMENKKVHCFDYSPRVDVSTIYEIMKNIEENETIIFVEYCLLTQWNIGILYILAHAFETLELQLQEDVGCLITLSTFNKSNGKIMKIIREIFEASINAKENNQIVISIFPIIKLCASEMYQSILKMNHGTIKELIHLIIKKVNS